MCLTFNKSLEKALKRQLAIDCLLIAEKGGEEKNFFLQKNAYPFMHVIKAIEPKSPVESHGMRKTGFWQPKVPKAVTY